MKNRALAAILILTGTFVLSSLALAEPSLQPKIPPTLPFQGVGGRDVSENAWQGWQAPVSTVDPDQLISSDSTDSTTKAQPQYHFDALKSDSLELAKSSTEGKPIQVEASKPIEKVDLMNTEPANHSTPLVATATPKTRSDWKLLVGAALCFAVLAYRKFRRTKVGPHPPKPNFL